MRHSFIIIFRHSGVCVVTVAAQFNKFGYVYYIIYAINLWLDFGINAAGKISLEDFSDYELPFVCLYFFCCCPPTNEINMSFCLYYLLRLRYFAASFI